MEGLQVQRQGCLTTKDLKGKRAVSSPGVAGSQSCCRSLEVGVGLEDSTQLWTFP